MQPSVMFRNKGRKHNITLKFDATNTKFQRSRNTMKCSLTNQVNFMHTVMHRLMMGIQSENCIVRQFRCHANVIECTYTNLDSTVKDKAVPLQAWTGPEDSRKLRLPDFVTAAQDGGRLSALRTGRFLPPGNTPGTHFCYRLS